MKKILFASLLLSITSVANAGFFDFLFGEKEEAAPAPTEQTAPAPETSSVGSTTETLTNAAIGLLPTLMGELSVDEKQAEGGMGALMQVAKDSLTKDEFGTLSAGVPGMDTLLAAAPALVGGNKASGGGLGGALSGLGGAATALTGLANLNQQFESLGLSTDMILQFANIAIQYFSKEGGDTGALLEKGLSSILG